MQKKEIWAEDGGVWRTQRRNRGGAERTEGGRRDFGFHGAGVLDVSQYNFYLFIFKNEKDLGLI